MDEFCAMLLTPSWNLYRSTLSEWEVDGSGLRLQPVLTVVLAVLIFRLSYLVLVLLLLQLYYLQWGCYYTELIKIIQLYQHNKIKQLYVHLTAKPHKFSHQTLFGKLN